MNWFGRAFSENDSPSSKRICGGLIILVVAFCTVWSLFQTGLTEIMRSLLETEIITASALLGLSSVTSIWKQKDQDNQE